MSEQSEQFREYAKECSKLLPLWTDLSSVWTMPVIHSVGALEPVRFNELRRIIPEISATSLSERLKTFQQMGVIQRKVYPETPPKVEYSLTERGWGLHAVLTELTVLAKRWLEQDTGIKLRYAIQETIG